MCNIVTHKTKGVYFMKKTLLRNDSCKIFLLTNYHEGSELDDVLEAANRMPSLGNIAVVMFGTEGYPLVHIRVLTETEDYDEAMRFLKEDIESDAFIIRELKMHEIMDREDISVQKILAKYLEEEGY